MIDSHTKVLDHGYVRFIERWGTDERIVEAARMSTDKGFQGWGPNCPHAPSGQEHTHDLYLGPTADTVKCRVCGTVDPKPGDEKLLKYLYDNRHMTPFEMAGLTLEIQAPIFVFREWHRHRTQSYNELSARYTPMPDLAYLPSVERAMLGGGHLTKQAGTIKGAAALTEDVAGALLAEERELLKIIEAFYQRKLQAGFPKELARTHLTVSRYSRMRASANLRNWLAFLTLRMDPAAQWEIRQFANVVGQLIAATFPRTWDLFAGPGRGGAGGHGAMVISFTP